MNTTQTQEYEAGKEEYIRSWNSYIDSFNRLAFCSDDELAKTVNDCIARLKSVVQKLLTQKLIFQGVIK